jgi:calcineurin-like phosphoesterase family protein
MIAPRTRVATAVALAAMAPAAYAGCGSERPPAAADAAGDPAPAGPAKRAVVWAVGDGADGSAAARRVAARIAAGRPDALLYLGDVYEDGTSADFRRNYTPTYGRLAAVTAPTPGNHEWPNHRRGYDPYWRRALKRRVGSFYAFRAGGWEFLSLNSEAGHGPGSRQERWLRARLRAPGTCRVAFWHRPRYSAGTHGDQADTAPLWNALRGHAAIVLGGHDHDMQRFKPIDGITQFVSGAGGRERYPVRRDRRLAFRNDSADGALRLEVRPGAVSHAFVDSAGRVLDRGTIRCSRPG